MISAALSLGLITPTEAAFLSFLFGAELFIPLDADADADANADLPPAAGATSLTLDLPAKYKGLQIVLHGTDLTTDGDGKPNGGMVTNMEFKFKGNTSTMQLVGPTAVTDLVAAAKAGSGKFNVTNYKDFFDLIIPGFTIQTGTGSKNGFEGNEGDDEFTGKGGADTNFMGAGNDVFNGGQGNDTIDAYQLNSSVTVDLQKGTASYADGTTTLKSVENAVGGKKGDILKGNGAANKLDGRNGADKIKGQGGNDNLKGGSGADLIEGGSGNDKMLGGGGDDVLKGGTGHDKMTGGGGNDKLKGGGGKDVFIFGKNEGKDKVLDFQDGKDKIDLSAFKFASKADALSHFKEVGGPNNDVSKFDYKGTVVTINGADLGDIGGADILI